MAPGGVQASPPTLQECIDGLMRSPVMDGVHRDLGGRQPYVRAATEKALGMGRVGVEGLMANAGKLRDATEEHVRGREQGETEWRR